MQFRSESFCALPASWARWKSAASRRISSQSDIVAPYRTLCNKKRIRFRLKRVKYVLIYKGDHVTRYYTCNNILFPLERPEDSVSDPHK